MRKNLAIKVDNLSKLYRLGEVGTGTLSHDLNRWWARLRGREDPYSKVGEVNDRNSRSNTDGYVWALDDINFEVEQGDVLGIIGKNGAGKSTLLKLLSKITAPTTGSIRARGRIASLLEVGTGMHPEMTGRENVYLNGTIMGMTRREIDKKFDEIMDFAGCSKYADTPVKRYSSGMKVRLGFAVAAFLEPEILIVDEVLAVGDVEFQKKAIGKMQEVSQGQGRTVLFVSHNMASIQALCNRGVLLDNGCVSFSGTARETISEYLISQDEQAEFNFSDRFSDSYSKPKVWYTRARLMSGNKQIHSIIAGQDVQIALSFDSVEPQERLKFFVGVYNQYKEKILNLGTAFSSFEVEKFPKQGTVICRFPKVSLTEGRYFVNLSLHGPEGRIDHVENAMILDVQNGDFYNNGKLPPGNDNLFFIEHEWSMEEVS